MRAGGRRGTVAVICLLLVALAGGCASLGFERPDSLMEEGRQLYLEKKYDEAIAKFERVIELDRTRFLAYVYLARCYIAKSSWGKAIANARLAYQASAGGEDVVATFGEALFGGGLAALTGGQFAEAIADFTEYIRLRPTDAQGYLGAGRAYLASAQYDQALGTLARGLQTDAGGALRSDLLRELLDGGVRAMQRGNIDSAAKLFQEYLRHDSSNAAAYLTMGKAFLQSGDRAQALFHLGRALQLNPSTPEASELLRGLR